MKRRVVPLFCLNCETEENFARENEIECQERELVVKDLLAASEVILTNSIMELMPVCHIEAHKVGDEKPGAVYRKLHDLYKQAVKDEC